MFITPYVSSCFLSIEIFVSCENIQILGNINWNLHQNKKSWMFFNGQYRICQRNTRKENVYISVCHFPTAMFPPLINNHPSVASLLNMLKRKPLSCAPRWTSTMQTCDLLASVYGTLYHSFTTNIMTLLTCLVWLASSFQLRNASKLIHHNIIEHFMCLV